MRRLLALVGLAGLIVLAGCGGSVVDQQALENDATYDWNTSSAATITVNESSYQLVYSLDNESEVALSIHDELTGTEPIPISAVQFRYSNGTVVDASQLTVEERDRRTVVEFPESDGQFAFTVQSGANHLMAPALTNRSHEVILPPGRRMSFPIFGGATPGNYETTIEDDRVHVTWETVETDVVIVDYYRQRDLLLFGGLIGLMLVIAGAGLLYYRSVIKRLEDERTEAGLDLE